MSNWDDEILIILSQVGNSIAAIVYSFPMYSKYQKKKKKKNLLLYIRNNKEKVPQQSTEEDDDTLRVLWINFCWRRRPFLTLYAAGKKKTTATDGE